MKAQKIKGREKTAILTSLRAGVVPNTGLQHIQVGRADEVQAILKDFEHVADDSASIRFIIGDYGSGKSFFLNLSKMVALEKGFIVANADISPDKRLHATKGQARGLYSELMKNISTRAKPAGGALQSIIERFISDITQDIRLKNGADADVTKAIHEKLSPLKDFVSGYDFATSLNMYFEGFQSSSQHQMDASLRWLRAEYSTKSQAAKDGLEVRSIIDDRNIYDYLKLMAAFAKLANYKGLVINLDEMAVLSQRLANKTSRDNNYETVLKIINDCLQGNVSNIGFIFAGTNDFLDNPRRGVESYQALADRLRGNSFAKGGLKDLTGPVIRLQSLKPEELYVLFQNLRHVYAGGERNKYLITDEAIHGFLQYSYSKLGAESYLSPRESVKGFVDFLSILDQNPGTEWTSLLPNLKFDSPFSESDEPIDDDDLLRTHSSVDSDLATLKL